jgi:hypothetical protein
VLIVKGKRNQEPSNPGKLEDDPSNARTFTDKALDLKLANRQDKAKQGLRGAN